MTDIKKCDSCGFKGDYSNVSRVAIYKHNLRFDLCLKCMKKMGVDKVTKFIEKLEKQKEQEKLQKRHRKKTKIEFKTKPLNIDKFGYKKRKQNRAKIKPTKKQLKKYPDCKEVIRQDKDGKIFQYLTKENDRITICDHR